MGQLSNKTAEILKKPLRGPYRWLVRRFPLLIGVTKAAKALISHHVDNRLPVFCEKTRPDHSLPVAVLVFDRGFFRNFTGSRRVVEAQIRALHHFGFLVCAVVVHTASNATRTPVKKEEAVELGLDVVFETAPRCTIKSFLRCAWLMRPDPIEGRKSMDERLTSSTLMPVPYRLSKFLNHRRLALTLVNYAWNIPLGKRISGDAPIIAETHDIQSWQIANSASQAFYEQELNAELQALGNADAIIALNSDEAKFFAKQFGSKRSALIYPPPKYSSHPELRLNPNEAIAKSGPASHAEQIASKAPILLFVGSRFWPNKTGFDWMIDQVFPIVSSRVPEAVLLVAGPVAEVIPPDRILEINRVPNVRILGRVDDLSPLYQVAKLVVIPIHEGTGVSIKTIEALSFGKPIVTTPVGLRGLPEEFDFPSEDRPEGFASRILTLLGSDEEQKIAQEQSRAFFKAHFSDETYYQAFGALLARVGVGLHHHQRLSSSHEGSLQ